MSRIGAAHREVPIKVNAWVDQGVVPLVAALNEFGHVLTLDSCQGGAGKPAHVLFRHVGGRRASAAFFFAFGKALGEKAAAVCEYDFRLRWLTGHGEPVAEIRTAPGYLGRLAAAVARIARTFRTRPCRRGRRGKGPRNSPTCQGRPRPGP